MSSTEDINPTETNGTDEHGAFVRAAHNLVHAADRMRDNWAETDEVGKRDLWRDLHTRSDELSEVLPAWIPTPEVTL